MKYWWRTLLVNLITVGSSPMCCRTLCTLRLHLLHVLCACAMCMCCVHGYVHGYVHVLAHCVQCPFLQSLQSEDIIGATLHNWLFSIIGLYVRNLYNWYYNRMVIDCPSGGFRPKKIILYFKDYFFKISCIIFSNCVPPRQTHRPVTVDCVVK